MAAMAAAMGIGRFAYTPILPGMMDSLGLSASDAGLIASSNYLGYLVGAVLASGNWGQGRERATMAVALLANAALAAAMALATAMTAFLAIRFLAGVASAFVMVFTSTIVFSRLAVAGRSHLQALHFGGVGFGILLSAGLTGGVFLAGAGWPANWYLCAVFALAGFALVVAMVREGPVAAGPSKTEPPLVWSAPLARIATAYGLFGAGYIVTATFLVAIVRSGNAGPLFESAVWLATGLAGLPSVWLWGHMVRRVGLTVTFATGCIVEAVGVTASVSLGGYLGPLLGGVLLGGTFIAITAFGLQAGRLLAGQSPRRALAIMTAAFGTGQIIGPILAGYGADWTGSFFVPSVGAAAVLLLSGLIGWESGRENSV
ncbi:MAG: YbfB/YjiJ family MFS transporter [Notoacmeibacter sp.]|nr:YbfB/YjiJ family MFS transporter [Notoacmeibacter sp.]